MQMHLLVFMGINVTRCSANGTETYYSTAATRAGDSKQLATFIQNRLYPAIGTKNRGVKESRFLCYLSKLHFQLL